MSEGNIVKVLRQRIFLKNANCVDDLVKAGIKSSDDLIKNGIINADKLLAKGITSADDLSRLGFSSVDDLVKLNIIGEEELEKLGLNSVEELKKIGVTSGDDFARIGFKSTVSPIIDILKNTKDWIKSLSNEEIEALCKYQSDDFYYVLNSALRNGDISEELMATIKNIDSAISKGSINNETKLYRGFTREDIIKNWDSILNGEQFQFTDEGYISISLNPSIADNFAMINGEDGIFAYVNVTNVNGANIDAIGSVDEAEILLERGLTCKITKAWEKNGYKYVIMEVSE